jgi:hypothetical protein
MPQINIPENVFPGFVEIAKLSKEQSKKFSSYLSNMPIGINFNKVFDEINDYLFSQLNVKSSRNIVQALISFGKLLESDYIREDLANELTNSFKESSPIKINEEEVESLKSNLSLIFKNSHRLKLTLKAVKLAYENENIFTESKIISDVRLIFNEDLKDKNRNAIILHRLHLVFKRNKKNEDLFITLDLHDLRELKEDIERAITKEEIIKEDYQLDLKFV